MKNWNLNQSGGGDDTAEDEENMDALGETLREAHGSASRSGLDIIRQAERVDNVLQLRELSGHQRKFQRCKYQGEGRVCFGWRDDDLNGCCS